MDLILPLSVACLPAIQSSSPSNKSLFSESSSSVVSSHPKSENLSSSISQYTQDPISSQQLRENSRESDIFRAMKSELDIEKWKNTGLRQIREEMNSSELARVSVMQKLCREVSNYEKEIADLKLLIGPKLGSFAILSERKNQLEEERNKAEKSWKLKEIELVKKISSLKQAKIQQAACIEKQKSDNSKMQAELQQLRTPQSPENPDPDLINKITDLQLILKNTKYDLSINKGNMAEAIEQLQNFQEHNTRLRYYIQSIEDRSPKSVESSHVDILAIIQNHLDALSIMASVEKISDDIFRIDNEFLNIFLEKGELMANLDGRKVTFVEWVQKNKWCGVDDKDDYVHKAKKLDTVPEEEEEEEIPMNFRSPKKPDVKASVKPQVSTKGKDFSPVLRKTKK